MYFAEWVDRWLMGDLVPGPGAVEGRRFQATCLSPPLALQWADQCGSQVAEQNWLANRLREAASGWCEGAGPYVLVVVREVFGPSATDEELQAAAGTIPAWLSQASAR
jgi:hypothetical protein